MQSYSDKSIQSIRKATLVFRALTIGTKPGIVYAILNNKNFTTVSEICDITGLDQATCSKQLRILRDARIIYITHKGRFHHYSVDKARIDFIINCAMSLIEEQSPPLGNR